MLSIVDRKKDILITAGGKNVSPSRIETALKASPYISEASVVEVTYNRVIVAVQGVSLKVPENAIVALLGTNGAGKSTTVRAISGFLPVGIWTRVRAYFELWPFKYRAWES